MYIKISCNTLPGSKAQHRSKSKDIELENGNEIKERKQRIGDHYWKCPIVRRQCQACSIQPSGLVRSSDGFKVPGMCSITISPSIFQSWKAKN